ncbi:AbgT family transporter [Corynebacterium poyangense]|uniref:AbgT family transporter n=2 Tax=Corynebacterium poyangense TaxID=2684405 RepID=A0A7H0SSK7_9CORY|nr:AbgT family transporter [Corynebacterium poyangense]QNQ91532.1 AbgT family transporter [Corynebacterium poyangense]
MAPMTTPTATRKPRLMDRALNSIEFLGNKLPEPFTLFLSLFLFTAIASTAMAAMNITFVVPGKGEETAIRGFFSAEGLSWITTKIGENYLGFPPLTTVLPILLAVGVAEKTGMLAALVRFLFGSAPRFFLPYAVGIVGVTASVMADAAFVIVPPLAAMVFKAAGRHPVAGLLGGFAAVGAGYSTALVPTSLDALFAGITNAVMQTLPDIHSNEVTPVSNYYFNIVSALLLGLIAGLIIDKVLEPRLTRQDIPQDFVDDPTSETTELSAELSQQEKAALRWSVLGGVGLSILIVVAVMIPSSPWRNESGGYLPKSPLLSSIVFIVVSYFLVLGLIYGRVIGNITGMRDVVDMMGQALKDMTNFLVLAFILGQFVALFAWTNIGTYTAVRGAAFLESIHLTGFGAILAFIILASFLNLLIISGSAMWTLMASVFVPMFALIGFDPAFIQAAFRVGDSATQVITPLNPYMIVILGLLRRYETEAGLGTLMSRLIPFVVPFWVAWAALLGIWYFLDLPLGPAAAIFLKP